MKNINVVVNYKSSMSLSKLMIYYKNNIDIFYVDVKKFGQNTSKSVLDNLVDENNYMILTDSFQTAFRLYKTYPNKVLFSTLDDRYKYNEISIDQVKYIFNLI